MAENCRYSSISAPQVQSCLFSRRSVASDELKLHMTLTHCHHLVNGVSVLVPELSIQPQLNSILIPPHARTYTTASSHGETQLSTHLSYFANANGIFGASCQWHCFSATTMTSHSNRHLTKSTSENTLHTQIIWSFSICRHSFGIKISWQMCAHVSILQAILQWWDGDTTGMVW